MSDIPLFDVMHLTGHKSLIMVQRYSHLAPDYQEGAIRVLDSRWHDLGTDTIWAQKSPPTTRKSLRL